MYYNLIKNKIKQALKLYVIALIFQFLSIINIICCPYEIVNDFKKPLLVINPNFINKVYYIEPKQKVNVDSAIENRLLSIIKYESLDFYLSKNNGEFIKMYSLIEKYCSNEKTTLAFSEIINMAKYPTDRFEVKVSYPDDLKS